MTHCSNILGPATDIRPCQKAAWAECEACGLEFCKTCLAECDQCGKFFCPEHIEEHTQLSCEGDFTGLIERLGGFTYEDLAEERIRKLAS